MSNLIDQLLITEPKTIARCVIALPGRGGSAEGILDFCKCMNLPDTLVVALGMRYGAWYKQPNSPNDQKNAVATLPMAIDEVMNTIDRVKRGWEISDENIAILGHSAGAVVSMQIVFHKKFNPKACVSLAGAILEPWEVPLNNKTTEIVLQHNKHDECFSWEERYLPMSEALRKNKYKVKRLIGDGSHNSYTWRIADKVSDSLREIMGIKEPESHDEV